ncbi:MAG: biopolymer transporter ExbD [Planctomycetaceae bacterium]|nr:biopolymer transporter ExbD [Planctomycetaceae bacterium]
MPIRFRCPHCKQTLSVSRKKAGTGVVCPACSQDVQVPSIEGIAPPAAAVPVPMDAAYAPSHGAEGDVLRFGDGDMEEANPAFVMPPVVDVGTPPDRQDTRSVWETDLGDWEEHPAFHNAPRRTIKDEADMTSMVDVTFLLLVFFMITASFSVTKALQSQPPSAEEGASGAPSPITMDELAEASVVVEIAADDSIRVDDVPVAGPVELGEVLAAKIGGEGKTELVIEAEYRATHGMVVTVTDVAMQAGMQRVRRVSRPEQQ